jgi:L-arabinose isomerase
MEHNQTIGSKHLHNKTWLITGSQHLYGEEVLKQVGANAQIIASHLHLHNAGVVTSPEEIYNIIQQANNDKDCTGIMCWMHTFSPAKMWIRGLTHLQKPLLHLHTQFHRDIPFESIDMDYMNLHQSAHGDREFAHILTRMNIKRKTVVGHWQDSTVQSQIDKWQRACVGWADWQGAKFVRFGDNMRYVAVTEGDKVSAEQQFGFSVNTMGVGEIVKEFEKISASTIAKRRDEYNSLFKVADQNKEVSLTEAAKLEVAIERILSFNNYKGFTTTFEDLHDLHQLPGLAAQRLMHKGYGYAAEGDWKTTALLRACKVMAEGLPGGNSFMEDYTYHFNPESEMVLGSHMLEICPSIAKDEKDIRLEVHPLGIGNKADPARLVFNAGAGQALNASLIDLGDKFRLVINEVEAMAVIPNLPKLPVARALWTPLPNMREGLKQWLEAGGAHHTVYSQNLCFETLEDFARIANLETVHIA